MTTDKDFKPGFRRGARQTLKLQDAYKAVFTMKQASPEALQMVLDDLAEFCGYFAVSPRGASAEETNYDNGQRSVFARIKSLTGIYGDDLERLRAAALKEMEISNEEGER